MQSIFKVKYLKYVVQGFGREQIILHVQKSGFQYFGKYLSHIGYQATKIYHLLQFIAIFIEGKYLLRRKFTI